MKVYQTYMIYQDNPWEYSDPEIFQKEDDAKTYADMLEEDLLNAGFTIDEGFDESTGRRHDDLCRYLVDTDGLGARIYIDEYEVRTAAPGERE